MGFVQESFCNIEKFLGAKTESCSGTDFFNIHVLELLYYVPILLEKMLSSIKLWSVCSGEPPWSLGSFACCWSNFL